MNSTALWSSLAAIVAAYLIGSLSFAVLVSRAFGLADPRSYGSKNPGATNVLRSGHRAAAILTLALDALKGYVPVWLALLLSPRFGFGETTIAFVGLAAFLGHLWPLFFRFEGGKGVATAAGVLLAFNPVLGLMTLGTWVIVAVFFRYSSLASIVSAAFAPFYQLLIWEPSAIALAIAVMSLLLVWRHSGNIRKLLAGTESRLGHKAAAPPTAAHGGTAGGRARRPRPRQTRPRQEEGAFGMIERIDVGPRMSDAVVHNGVVYLAGQVSTGGAMDISGQTREVLAAIDALLARAGTDKSRVLRAQIFLADMADFPGMNAVWDQWVAPGHTPARATVQAALAKPQWKVEIVVTAALP